MREDIGTKTDAGIIEYFTDNSIPICARCEFELNEDNKSKRSDVIENNKTQYICKSYETICEEWIDESIWLHL